MAVPSLDTFLQLLRDSQLLEPEQFDELARDPQVAGLDARSLARRLVRRGWLTEYQIYQALKGRGKELTLGPYRLLDRLGEGGMGQVFKAYHQPMHRTVALKLIRKEKLAHPQAVPRFYREIRAAAQLVHPNIVLAYDAGEVAGTHFFAMEYVEGKDLERLVEELGPLPVAQACDYIRQAALGLQHAHERGMVHRDIKPSNLIVTRSTGPVEKAVVKVLDMGLVRREGIEDEPAVRSGGLAQDTALTQAGRVIGTVAFLAPEQARNSHLVDIRADLYSLGCTFFYLLTGQEPYRGETALEIVVQHRHGEIASVTKLRPEVPPEVDVIIRKLMAKRPEDRYQTPAELAAALEPLCRGSNGALETPQFLWEQIVATPERDWGMGGTEMGQEPRALPRRNPMADRTVLLERKPAPAGGPAWWSRLPAGKRWLVLGGIAAAGLLGVAALFFVLGKSRPPATEKEPPAGVPTSGPEQPRPPEVEKPRLPREPLPLPEWEAPRQVARFDKYADLVACSPNGRLVLSLAKDNVPCLWDLADGQELRRLVGHVGLVTSLAFSPDGGRVLSGGRDGSVRLWDAETGKMIRQYKGHTAGVHSVAYSNDGRFALSGSGVILEKDGKREPTDLTVRLWDVETGQEVKRFEGHTGAVNSVAFAPDGRQVASGGWDETVRLWDVATGKEVHRFLGHTGAVTAVAFAPNGRQVLSGSRDKTLRLWDTTTGKEVRAFEGHENEVHCLAFSRDGDRILSGGWDKTVRLWNAASGRQIQRFDGHEGWVTSVTFTARGRRALSADFGKAVLLWQLPRLD